MSFTGHSALAPQPEFSSSAFRASKPTTRNWNLKLETFLTLLRPLGAVLRTSLHPARDSHRIQCSPNQVIPNARQILHTPPANEHNRVLLQVVTDAGNISRHFNPVCQAHPRHLPQRRVGLLRGLRIHTGTHTALLRASLQCRTGRLVTGPLATLSHQLVKRRHALPLLSRTTAAFNASCAQAQFLIESYL